MTDFLAELTAKYDRYVDTFRGADGELPSMMQLKRVHTAMVVRNAELIADGEGFDALTRETAVAAALLHDTGRYEQLKRYNTFKDSDSVDHAVFSHDIVEKMEWLSEVEAKGGGGEWRDAVLKAVLYHNRRDVPDKMDALTAAAAHTVRDADKLDIFRVLEDRVEHSDWQTDTRAFWNLKVSAPPSPVVVDCIEHGRPVDYQNVKVLADFVLIQVGWMISGLHFATARRLCWERDHLRFRREFLHRLTDDESVDRLCDLAKRKLDTCDIGRTRT